jgi:PAS domain S-box-containing protein
MGSRKKTPPTDERTKRLTALREQAERIIKEQEDRLDSLPHLGVKRLAQELATHQFELEIQNEELQKAQIELDASRRKYAELYDFAPVGYFTLDAKGIILEANVTGADMLGTRKGLIVRKPFRVYIQDSSDKRKFHEHCTKVLNDQVKHSCELILKGMNAKPFYARLESILFEDDSTGAKLIRTVVSDITERKKAEDTVAKLWGLYESILESTTEGIYAVDQHGNHTVVNRASVQMLGYDIDEVMGRPSHSTWHHTRADGTPFPEDKCRIYATLRDGISKTVTDEVFWKKDGTPIPVEYAVSPIRVRGEITGAVIVFRDISERKQAEERLLRAKEEWERTFESVPDAIMIINKDNTIARMNKAMAQRMGRSDEECRGLRCYEVVCGDSEPPYFCPHVLAMKDGKEHIEEVHDHRLGGDFLISTTPLFDKGEIIGSVHVARDITERRRAEQQREQALAELRRSNRDLAQFAHVISHDLQAPLLTIAGFAARLVKNYHGRLDTRADDCIHRIVTGVDKMKQMIEDILTYSKVGSPTIKFTDIDSELVLTQALANLQALIEERRAVIARQPLPTIRANKTQMVVLFQNIIGNAIKFSTRQPHVHISAEGRGSEVLFMVSDNGIGILPENMERIFELFQRLHSETEYPGTGTGLAVCKKIVERHGGKIWVESKEGEGSAFFFTIPSGNSNEYGRKETVSEERNHG